MDELLPEGWILAKSKTYGKTYFFNTFSGESSWQRPAFDENESLTKKDSKNMNNEILPSPKRIQSSDVLAKVAIIVPYRDEFKEQLRSKHLAEFIPEMTKFMSSLSVIFHIYIIEQSNDNRKFNRGKLLNIGYRIARQGNYNVFILHDVDLIPSIDLGPWYATYPEKPCHIARRWPRYSGNKNYCGGIVSISARDYEAINGYPNTFWGWGGEDDEMMKRFREIGLEFTHPNIGTIRDLEDMSLTEKMSVLKKNQDWKCMVKHEALDEHKDTWRENGLSNLNFSVIDSEALNSFSSRITVDVKLNNHWTDTITSVNQQTSNKKNKNFAFYLTLKCRCLSISYF